MVNSHHRGGRIHLHGRRVGTDGGCIERLAVRLELRCRLWRGGRASDRGAADNADQQLVHSASRSCGRYLKLRTALDHRIGEVQLPELLLQVDAQVRFSWIMLGREPRSQTELLMVYAGILAQGTSMSAADTARMMSQLSAADVRQAMRWAGDEHRLADACAAVLAYMHRHPIAATWVALIWRPPT
jgi:hypothetical protein